jgi:hypothetical protein
MVSLLLMIGHCQLCGEEQVDVPLAVHSPFNMPYNNDVTKKKHEISQVSNISPLSEVRGKKKLDNRREKSPSKTSSGLQFDTCF